MEQLKTLIENQYFAPSLYEDILHRLDDQHIDLDAVSRDNISGVDEFHVRGAEVSKELANEIDLKGVRVLDVGCGIGGPARMLADEYDCQVTGIDMSGEFIRTAKNLSRLVGLSSKTEFIQADALNLPFKDGSYDVVWTQHVQMNIEDKARFYSEITRVLTDEGLFVYYDIFKRKLGAINYPVPWANDASLSFLQSTASMEAILEDLGYCCSVSTDQTNKATQFLAGLFEKIKQYGLPKLGLNVLMGSSTGVKLKNVLKGLEEKQLILESGVYKK